MIKTRKNLERQQTFSYTLTIGVSDQGKPARIAKVGTDFLAYFTSLQSFPK